MTPPQKKRLFPDLDLLGVSLDIPHIQTRACARGGRNRLEVRSVDSQDGS